MLDYSVALLPCQSSKSFQQSGFERLRNERRKRLDPFRRVEMSVRDWAFSRHRFDLHVRTDEFRNSRSHVAEGYGITGNSVNNPRTSVEKAAHQEPADVLDINVITHFLSIAEQRNSAVTERRA